MLKFLPTNGDVIAAETSGKVSRAEMEEMLDRIEAAIDANETVHFFCSIADYDGFETDGLPDIMARGWKLIGKREKLGRIAVVTDTSWLRWAARLESALLPGISYETFTMDERDRALAWVKGKEEMPHREAFTFIETDDPEILGFALNGRVSAQEMERVSDDLNDRLEHGSPKRMLGRFTHYRGFSPAGIMDEDFWAMKRDMIRTLDRYALVGAPNWMTSMIRALDPLFRVEVRCFESDAEADAWAWLGATPRAEQDIAA